MDLKMILFLKYVGAFLTSFILSLIINKIIIKLFRYKKWKQVERKYLQTHIVKEGTPSLGGLGIMISSLISLFVYSNIKDFNREIVAVIFGFIAFGLIGLWDDYAKIKNKKEDGLSGKKRLFLEGVIVLYILVILGFNVSDFIKTEINIFNKHIFLGALFIPFIMFVIVGCANSVNLSDGLDGLSSGLVVCSILPFAIIAIKNEEISLSIFILAVIGSILGFMIYNLHPAKIFMGDTGSLSLGALLACVSIYLDKIYVLPIAALIFILESLSVIIQVLYYKKTKKRIFLMTPFHHHYEKKGIKEYRIVNYFWLLGLILSVLSALVGGLL